LRLRSHDQGARRPWANNGMQLTALRAAADAERSAGTQHGHTIVESGNACNMGSGQGCCESQEAQGLLRGGAAALADPLAITGADSDHSVGEARWSPSAFPTVSGSLPWPIPRRTMSSGSSAHGQRHVQNVGPMKIYEAG
jgi:hypothetical protein